MAKASHTTRVQVSREKMWKVICDYASYPDFVEGCETVEVLSREENKATVKYAVSLLGKEIHYTLDHTESLPEQMKWNLIDSNIMKTNSGSWGIKEISPTECEITYDLELEFKIYVPGMVLNGLVKNSLPKMVESFVKRAKK